jgi:hypothetical protein
VSLLTGKSFLLPHGLAIPVNLEHGVLETAAIMSVQITEQFFTYMGLVGMPGDANFLHVIGWHCPDEKNEPGSDLRLPQWTFGFIWFTTQIIRSDHLILNCLFQFVNQNTKSSFELRSEDNFRRIFNFFFWFAFHSGSLALVCSLSHLKSEYHR